MPHLREGREGVTIETARELGTAVGCILAMALCWGIWRYAEWKHRGDDLRAAEARREQGRRNTRP